MESNERSGRHAERAHVLIAGGGVAALEAALALRELAAGRVSVELLAPEQHFWYRPLSVAEPFGLGDVLRLELSSLAATSGATLSPGTLVSVDAARRIAYADPGGAMSYSMLLIACGTVSKPAIEGAITFRGPADTGRIADLLAEIQAGDVRRVAFVVPAGVVWSLPAYELALMTAAWVQTHGLEDVSVALVTPEDEPLGYFGQEAAGAVRTLLDAKGVALTTGAYPAEVRTGELLLAWNEVVAADRVVALPRLQGTRIGGVPQSLDGFIPVDDHGRIAGLERIYAAGDITTFPLKQGGIATQLADAAAEAIAAEAGADVTPRPFRPVLRGLLLTGGEPRFLRADLAGDRAESSQASPEPLWWPPAKIVGQYLAPFLADVAGRAAPGPGPPPDAGVPVEIELDAAMVDPGLEPLITAAIEGLGEEEPGLRVGEIMSRDPLVVSPEDTLGEVAERMRERDFGSALVADYGRLVGILTSRDLLRALADRVHSSEARVRQWMTAEPVTVTTTSTVEAAAVLMAAHDIHHLAVVDADRPVGMVGMREVSRARAQSGAVIGLGF